MEGPEKLVHSLPSADTVDMEQFAGMGILLSCLLLSAAGASPFRRRVRTADSGRADRPSFTPGSRDVGLQRNPELAALRQQRGIAAAAIVIANTYPLNPTWGRRIRHADGPISATITNRVPTEQNLIFPVEVRGQRTFRRQDAAASQSRTEWEIADQELALAVRIIRAFDTTLFHEGRVRLLAQTLEINTQAADRVQRMVQAGRLTGADLIVTRAEVNDARAALAAERTVLSTAQADLRKALGTVTPSIEIQGVLDAQVPTWDAARPHTSGPHAPAGPICPSGCGTRGGS